jgi:hypothetical protein
LLLCIYGLLLDWSLKTLGVFFICWCVWTVLVSFWCLSWKRCLLVDLWSSSIKVSCLDLLSRFQGFLGFCLFHFNHIYITIHWNIFSF